MANSTLITLAAFGAAALTVAAPKLGFANEGKFDTYIREAADKYNVPFAVIKAMIATESGFNPNAQSDKSSAKGLMQIVDGTARELGYSPAEMLNPQKAIDAGAKYIASLKNSFGLWGAIRAYYAGPGNYRSGKRADESLQYASKVYSYAGAFVASGETWA